MSRVGRHRRNLRRYVYLRDRAICWLCSLFVSWDDFTLDHVVPSVMGGLRNRENCRAAHATCNTARGCKVEGLCLLPAFGPPVIKPRDQPGFSR